MGAFDYITTVSFKIFITGLILYGIYLMIQKKQSGYLPIILLFLYYIYYFLTSRSYLEQFNDISENNVPKDDDTEEDNTNPFTISQ